MDKILITGGAGFIGSHVVERIATEKPDANIVVLDKLTYAADIRNLDAILDGNQRRLVKGDVCDFDLCVELTKDVDCIIHMAAESHVDNAFGNSLVFTRSNTLGTHTLLEVSRVNEVTKFIHVSTDEVYGEIRDGMFDETSILNPSNPYSGSKASAEMIVNSYRHSFNTPVVTVRANNIFGIRQFPEKIIPKFTMQAITGKKMTVHGDGSNRRCYLAVEDFAESLALLIHKGKVGEIYNVGNTAEFTNIEIAKMICAEFGLDPAERIEFVADRPFNDFRYSIDFSKISRLGWRPARHLTDMLPGIIDWYRAHRDRYLPLFDENVGAPSSGLI